jgi:hypothetical protein
VSAGINATSYFGYSYVGTQFTGNSPIPTLTAGPGAGTGPANVSLAAGSTSVSGTIVFKTGTTPAADIDVMTVTFATPLVQVPGVCIASAENPATATASKSLYIASQSTTGFVLYVGDIPLTQLKEYLVGYACF